MILSRIKLDMSKRKTMLALSDPALFHGAIEASFPGERERKLWRIDTLHGETYLLVLSPEEGNFRALEEQFGMESSCESKPYEPLLERIAAGTHWRFRLCANPVKSVFQEGKRGTVHGHITSAYQKEWLLDRCEKHGFLLSPESFEVTRVQQYRFHKGCDSRFVTLLSATYDGRLTVKDPETFSDCLTAGIGRGKAYGMGLLTIVRDDIL